MEWAIAVYVITGGTIVLYLVSLWRRNQRLNKEREAWEDSER